MQPISLKEFQKIAGLSDSSLVWLLVNKRLACCVDDNQQIMVRMDKVKTSDLLDSILKRQRESVALNESLILERFTSIIAENLEEICARVMAQVVVD